MEIYLGGANMQQKRELSNVKMSGNQLRRLSHWQCRCRFFIAFHWNVLHLLWQCTCSYMPRIESTNYSIFRLTLFAVLKDVCSFLTSSGKLLGEPLQNNQHIIAKWERKKISKLKAAKKLSISIFYIHVHCTHNTTYIQCSFTLLIVKNCKWNIIINVSHLGNKNLRYHCMKLLVWVT